MRFGVLLAGLSIMAAPGFAVVAAPAELASVQQRVLAVESYGLDQGLAQSTVTSLAQDQQGFLWFGTQEGLHRFDGHRFSVLRRQPGQSDGLISSSIDHLLVDDMGRLWLGSNDAGIEVLSFDRFDRWRLDANIGLSHDRIVSLALLPQQGSALVATAAGLDRVRPMQGEVERLLDASGLIGAINRGDGHWLAADQQCRLYSAREHWIPEGFSDQRCVALHQGGDGSVWLFSETGPWLSLGHDRSDSAQRFMRPAGLSAALSAVLVEDDGRILLGDVAGNVYDWQPADGQLRQWRLDIEQSAVLRFFRDRSGVLWIGSYTSGLHRVLPYSEQLINAQGPQFDTRRWSSSSIRALHRQDQNWLVGTDGGLAIGQAANWHWPEALQGNPLRAIEPMPDQDGFWLGTHQGVKLWRSADQSVELLELALPDPRITDLQFHDGLLWIATRGGLAVHATAAAAPPVPDALRDRFLTTLAVDAEGRILVGSNEDGLFRFRPGQAAEQLFAGDRDLSTESIWAIWPRQDQIWLGTFGGGLLRIDAQGRQLEQWTREQGMPNDVVYRILADRQGRLWMSTNYGLAIFDPDRGNVQQIGRRDGLINQEYNAGAALADAQGRLYFGGVRGIDSLATDTFDWRSAPARPVITELNVAHQQIGLLQSFDGLDSALPVASELRLRHKQRTFSLRMAALDFNAPSAARLRYRVEGLHSDWVESQAPEAEFAVHFLSPGRYRLLIEAAGRDGQYGQRHELLLLVQPPPWRHPLAYTLYAVFVLLACGLVALRIRRREQSKARQVEHLNRLVAERTVELEALNQQLTHSNRRLDMANRRDPLTGASNRRDFLDWMAREQHRATDASPPLLLFMIDIDDFKLINDRHGHSVGDRVLVAFAARLKAFCRERDLLVRWGGEEFLLVVDAIEQLHAADLAERIVCAVASSALIDQPITLKVSCSIGFAPWPFDASGHGTHSWEQSVELADQALYQAKAAGKNGWVGVKPGANWRPESDISDRTLEQLLAAGLIERIGRTRSEP